MRWCKMLPRALLTLLLCCVDEAMRRRHLLHLLCCLPFAHVAKRCSRRAVRWFCFCNPPLGIRRHTHNSHHYCHAVTALRRITFRFLGALVEPVADCQSHHIYRVQVRLHSHRRRVPDLVWCVHSCLPDRRCVRAVLWRISQFAHAARV